MAVCLSKCGHLVGRLYLAKHLLNMNTNAIYSCPLCRTKLFKVISEDVARSRPKYARVARADGFFQALGRVSAGYMTDLITWRQYPAPEHPLSSLAAGRVQIARPRASHAENFVDALRAAQRALADPNSDLNDIEDINALVDQVWRARRPGNFIELMGDGQVLDAVVGLQDVGN